MKKPKTFPQTIKDGSVSVRIYATPVNGYEAFTVSWYEDGKRQRLIRSDYKKARVEAEDVLRKLNLGMAPSQQLRGEDKVAYLSAIKKLQPIGISLGEAVQDYTTAYEALDRRTSLSDAVRFFLSHSPDLLHEKTVTEAYDVYLERAENRTSKRNVETVKLHVGRFAAAFQCPLSDVTHNQIEAWLIKQDYSPRYSNNCRAALITFFRWCRKQRFLPNLETEAEKMEKRPELIESVSIFDPETMKKILSHVRNDLTPYLALSAFGGLRPSEARRITWENIHWEDSYIEINASQARKTLRDRFIPLHPNLKAWLEPFQEETGLVAQFKRPHEMMTSEHKKMEFFDEWPEDVLRHSYGSYRLALIKDTQKLASEMGNSPEIIVKNYRRPVSEKAAKEWFDLSPA
ncbi:MAG: hypothetical protein P1U86_05875 [Verrucomicrobiales bacterium]|nr:hypothetical protein [Verrucomicrobiales bacterium]